MRRADLVLHLHSFDNQQPVAGPNLLAPDDPNLDDLPRHRGEDFLWPLATVDAAAPPATSRVEYLHQIVAAAHCDRHHAEVLQ